MDLAGQHADRRPSPTAVRPRRSRRPPGGGRRRTARDGRRGDRQRIRRGPRSRRGRSPGWSRLPPSLHRAARTDRSRRARHRRRRDRPRPHRHRPRRRGLRGRGTRGHPRLLPGARRRHLRRHGPRMAAGNRRVGGQRAGGRAPEEQRPSAAPAHDPPFVSARLAIQDPGDLPHHRAVVRRRRPAAGRRRAIAAGPRPRRRRRRDRVRPGVGAQATAGNARDPPRLVHLASARLGPADPCPSARRPGTRSSPRRRSAP